MTQSQPPATPPGWYPAAHAENQMRYWDGANWHETPPPPAAHAAPAPTRDPKKLAKQRWERTFLLGVIGILLVFLGSVNSGPLGWGLVATLMQLAGAAAVLVALVTSVIDLLEDRKRKRMETSNQ